MRLTPNFSDEQKEIMHEALVEFSNRGTLVENTQKMVNFMAAQLIEEYPEIAEETPKAIGQTAKVMVFNAMREALGEVPAEVK